LVPVFACGYQAGNGKYGDQNQDGSSWHGKRSFVIRSFRNGTAALSQVRRNSFRLDPEEFKPTKTLARNEHPHTRL
jgi:hypothetical protein